MPYNFYNIEKLSFQKKLDLHMKQEIRTFDNDPIRWGRQFFPKVRMEFSSGELDADGRLSYELYERGYRGYKFMGMYRAQAQLWGYEQTAKFRKSLEDYGDESGIDPESTSRWHDYVDAVDYYYYWGKTRNLLEHRLQAASRRRGGYTKVVEQQKLRRAFTLYLWIPLRSRRSWSKSFKHLHYRYMDWYYWKTIQRGGKRRLEKEFIMRDQRLIHNRGYFKDFARSTMNNYRHCVFWYHADEHTVAHYNVVGRHDELTDQFYSTYKILGDDDYTEDVGDNDDYTEDVGDGDDYTEDVDNDGVKDTVVWRRYKERGYVVKDGEKPRHHAKDNLHLYQGLSEHVLKTIEDRVKRYRSDIGEEESIDLYILHQEDIYLGADPGKTLEYEIGEIIDWDKWYWLIVVLAWKYSPRLKERILKQIIWLEKLIRRDNLPISRMYRHRGNLHKLGYNFHARWNHLWHRRLTYNFDRQYNRDVVWFMRGIGLYPTDDTPYHGRFSKFVRYDAWAIERYFFAESKAELFEDMDLIIIEKFFARMGVYVNTDAVELLYISELTYAGDKVTDVEIKSLSGLWSHKWGTVSTFAKLYRFGNYLKSHIGLSGVSLRDRRLFDNVLGGKLEERVIFRYKGDFIRQWIKRLCGYDRSLHQFFATLMGEKKNHIYLKFIGDLGFGVANDADIEKRFFFSSFILNQFSVHEFKGGEVGTNVFTSVTYWDLAWLLHSYRVGEGSRERIAKEEEYRSSILQYNHSGLEEIWKSYKTYMYYPLTATLGQMPVYSLKLFLRDFLFKCLKNFIGMLVRGGKKISAEYFWYDVFYLLKGVIKDAHNKLKSLNFYVLLVGAILNLEPTIMLLPRRQGGKVIWLGAPIWSDWKRFQLVMKWLILDYKRDSKRSTVSAIDTKRLIVDTYNGVGEALDKKQAEYKVSTKNRPFAYLLRPKLKGKKRRKRFITMHGCVR